MDRPPGAPCPRSARQAEPAAAGVPQAGLGFEDLNWTEVADTVWLAAAITPATAAAEPSPEEEAPKPSVHPVRHLRTEPREKSPPPRLLTVTDIPAPGGEPEEQAVTATGPAPAEQRHPTVDGVGTDESALSDLEYFRALRTLKRKTPSPRPQDMVLDEEATAARVAETGQWWPVTRRREERWLDLTIVLDNGPSMALWRPRVSAFVTVLERLGAFRTIQVRLLETAKVNGESTLVLRGGTPGAPARDPAEIVTTGGRRAVLLVTDGVGDAWQKDVLYPMLAHWGSAMPVSIVHLLPQWLWGRCGLSPRKAKVRVPSALTPNSRWTCHLTDSWLEPDSPEQARIVPIPLLELQPRWLAWWARLIAGEHAGPAEGTVLLASDRGGREHPDAPLTPFHLPRKSTASGAWRPHRRYAWPNCSRLFLCNSTWRV